MEHSWNNNHKIKILYFIKIYTIFSYILIFAGSGISAEEKQTILLVHNKLRQQVANGRIPNQPAATNMQEITWDDKLAESAQNWADNCQFRHDPNRTTGEF